MVRLLVAAVVCLVILRLGLVVLRALARPAPEPPPPGELRRVNLRYRCPRHCMEEMVEVAPAFE